MITALCDTIASQLQAGRPVLWMFDYDGTLVPLASRPELAIPSAEVSARFLSLCRVENLCPAIISGRSVAQLQAMLPALLGEVLFICGLHGGEVYDSACGKMVCAPDAALPGRVKTFRQKLTEHLAAKGICDVLIEDKIASLALHTREATEENGVLAQTAFLALFGEADLSLEKDFRLQFGKKIVELVPKSFHKGVSVDFLMRHATRGGPSPFSVYVGDDLTDEAAFEVVNTHGGLTVRVEERGVDVKTNANYLFPDVAAVQDMIAGVLGRVSG